MVHLIFEELSWKLLHWRSYTYFLLCGDCIKTDIYILCEEESLSDCKVHHKKKKEESIDVTITLCYLISVKSNHRFFGAWKTTKWVPALGNESTQRICFKICLFCGGCSGPRFSFVAEVWLIFKHGPSSAQIRANQWDQYTHRRARLRSPAQPKLLGLLANYWGPQNTGLLCGS